MDINYDAHKEQDDSIVYFTKEMKKTHKILAPMMLPVHFEFLQSVLRNDGYDIDILTNDGQPIIDAGLQHVHNDTCYPALLVIGQMIDALKTGDYDLDHVALAITQTGGGCRASNYIHLLRKALKQADMGQIPVISVNFANLESQSGFVLSKMTVLRAVVGFLYGDLLLWLKNQTVPYEVNKGETQQVLDELCADINKQLTGVNFLRLQKNFDKIVKRFAAIELTGEKKTKVGIVGEIYMKYAPAGNNHLEEFLINEGCEPVVSGVLDFGLYCMENVLTDHEYYGRNKKIYKLVKVGINYVEKLQAKMNKSITKYSNFSTMDNFQEIKKNGEGFIDRGVKMGEGWLLTSEMLTLIKSDVNNIVCCQPFGCLPNHIVAKGMMRKIKDVYPESNIVAIDYDPSATPVNQENRLKLMLSNAKLNEQFKSEKADI